MSNLILLNFQGKEIRFVGTLDKPEWVAADVIAILYPDADKRNHNNYLTRLPSEWLHHKPIMTNAGTREMTTVYEPGLYYMLARSNSPIAVPFQKWLFEEVLPSIRKTGKYSASTPPTMPAPTPRFPELDLVREQAKLAIDIAGAPGATAAAVFQAITFTSTIGKKVLVNKSALTPAHTQPVKDRLEQTLDRHGVRGQLINAANLGDSY